MHLVPTGPEAIEANFERVWLRDNEAGVQLERWFHFAGLNICRWPSGNNGFRDT